MRKTAIALLCLASLLLQGCWTTMTKENPLYGDCSSYHDRGRADSQDAHYVTAVSASARRCYGAGGEKLSQAKESAMGKCKNAGGRDCAIYAENKKITLSPTIKDRDVDWDGTFTLLTLGMAGAVAYESGKSVTPSASAAYIPPPAYTSLQQAKPTSINSSATAAGSVVGSAAPSSRGSLDANGPQYIPDANRCVVFERGKKDGNASWFTLRNHCSFSVKAHWCDSRGERCDTSAMAEIPPGGKTSSWYLNTKYTGISRGACPSNYNGKTVVESDWRCQVLSW